MVELIFSISSLPLPLVGIPFSSRVSQYRSNLSRNERRTTVKTQDLSASDDDDDYGGRWVGRVGDYIKLSVCGEWQSWRGSRQ